LKSVRLEPVERRGVFDKALLSLSKGSARTELILHRAGSIEAYCDYLLIPKMVGYIYAGSEIYKPISIGKPKLD
jgi:hypothetical protein